MMGILIYLDREGKKTQRELIVELAYSPRTIRYSLRMMSDHKILKKVPNLRDMRSTYYAPGPCAQDYI